MHLTEKQPATPADNTHNHTCKRVICEASVKPTVAAEKKDRYVEFSNLELLVL